MEKLVEVLVNSLTDHVTIYFEKFLYQIKKYIVYSKIKNIPKINDSNYETNKSSLSISNYGSIKPLIDNYSSIKILSSEGFKYDQQKITIQDVQKIENIAFEKLDFLEKHMNSTSKQIIILEQLPTSQYSLKDISQYNKSALQNIEKANYLDHIHVLLNLKKDSKQEQFISIMKGTKKPLSFPLTKLDPKYHTIAILHFDSLLDFIDNLSNDSHCVIASTLANKVKQMPQELIEQAYVQLIKQLKNSTTFKIYLQVFAVYAAFVKVPLRLYLPLLNFCLAKHRQHPSNMSFIFYLFIKNFNKPRVQGILPFEASAVMHMKKIPVIIDLPTQKIFYMESTSSVEDLIIQMVNYFELDKEQNYIINYKQGYLNSGSLFDGFYSIDSKRQGFEKQYYRFTGFRVVLIPKNIMRCVNQYPYTDLLYSYESKKYLANLYKNKKKQILQMAAYKYYGENDGIHQADLALYIPKVFITYYGEKFWASQLAIRVRSIKCSKRQARKQFLRVLKKKEPFLAHIFSAKIYVQGTQQLQFKIMLYLSPGFIYLMGIEDSMTYKKIRFNQIQGWGKTRSQLCLKYKTTRGYKVVHIQACHQSLVNDIFATYLQSIQEYANQKELHNKDQN